MAKYKLEVPEEVLKDLQFIDSNYEKIFGGMTQDAAKNVYKNVIKNAPSQMKSNSEIMSHLKVSKVYKTPSDGGINSKVLFSGYYMHRKENGELVKTPVPLVANMFEYGNHKKSDKYPKKPFFRKSFNKKQIEQAMLKAQKELSGGILDE